MTSPTDERDPNVVYAEYQREFHREWTTWRAKDAIYVGNALGYNAGDPVAASTVERMSWDKMGLVVPFDDDAAIPADVDAQARQVSGPSANAVIVIPPNLTAEDRAWVEARGVPADAVITEDKPAAKSGSRGTTKTKVDE